jgi:hypothetical protein
MKVKPWMKREGKDGCSAQQPDRADPNGSFKGGNIVNATKIAAIVLIVAGIFGLVYGGFSYTKNTHEAKLGPLELSVKDTQRINVPVWAGVAGIVAGGGLLLLSRKKG